MSISRWQFALWLSSVFPILMATVIAGDHKQDVRKQLTFTKEEFMNSAVTSILTFLEGSKQFVIPIYQRTYEWKREQCSQFWEDLLLVGGNQEPKPHFFGSIVYMDPEEPQNIGDVQKILVIDGQQRLTTLSLLISALSRVIQEQGVDIGISPKELSNRYLFNDNKVGESRYKQILTKSDKETLICLLEEDRELPTPYSPLLDKNYRFFYSECKKANLEIVYRGIERLEIVSIVLDPDQDEPQLIFETLNVKGLDLSETDKIRNYLLMGKTLDSQTRLYNDLWYPIEQRFRNEDQQFKRFMRHYLTLKTRKIPKLSDIYKNFKSYVKMVQSSDKLELEEIVKEVSRYSKHYLALLHEEDTQLKACLTDLHELKADTAYPFLLKVYDYYVSGKIEKAEVIETVRLIESYIFRRAVCGLSNKFLNHIFVDILREMNTDGEHNYLENLNETFLELQAQRRYPRNREFRIMFTSKDMSNFSGRDYLLRKLENYERKEPIEINEYTVEHVMPQTLTDAWKQDLGNNYQYVHELFCNNIGNLTLTGRNSELSNRPFKEKRDMLKEGFRYSPLYLNQDIREAEEWNQDTITARARNLAERACEIWAYPTGG